MLAVLGLLALGAAAPQARAAVWDPKALPRTLLNAIADFVSLRRYQ